MPLPRPRTGTASPDAKPHFTPPLATTDPIWNRSHHSPEVLSCFHVYGRLARCLAPHRSEHRCHLACIRTVKPITLCGCVVCDAQHVRARLTTQRHLLRFERVISSSTSWVIGWPETHCSPSSKSYRSNAAPGTATRARLDLAAARSRVQPSMQTGETGETEVSFT